MEIVRVLHLNQYCARSFSLLHRKNFFMDPQNMLRADPLDILFDDRNKSYGAYPLRKYYAQRLWISFGVTLSLVLILSGLYLHFRSIPLSVRTFILSDPRLEPLDPADHPSKIKPPPAKPRVAAFRPVARVEHVTMLITPDQQVIKPVATTEELSKAMIGIQTAAGPPDSGETTGRGIAKGSAAPQARDSAEGTREVFTRAELMPEFPGGMEALKRFLLHNLRMPENNLDPGTRIQVMARFVVGPDGRVRDIEIMQPAADAFNREVMRVIEKMPDWKPGMQNHRAVAVYFMLPVNFENAD
jgi:periplasmic protein TonB